MKKIITLILLILVSLKNNAQNIYYISNNAIAFEQPYTSSKTLGFFVRGAKIQTYNNLNDEWIKAIRDYQEPIYIQNFNVKKRLNVDDKFEKSLAPVIDSDDYYASPHLFVNVAGLKYREYPNNKTVSGIITNGSVVQMSYYPFNENEWVSLGEENGFHIGFIQRKFLGQRPDLNELVSNYENAINNNDKKKWAERILELGWNSNKDECIKALETYKKYAEINESNEINLRINNQLKFLNASKKRNNKNIEKLIIERKIGFTLNNEIEPKEGFSKATLTKYLGFPINSYTDLDDCTLGDFETNIFYNAAELVGHDVNKTTYVRKMNMINFNGFKIDGHQFNENTTTDGFISKTIGFISEYDHKTETYFLTFPFTEATFSFKFVNNKLWEVQLIYFC